MKTPKVQKLFDLAMKDKPFQNEMLAVDPKDKKPGFSLIAKLK